MKGIFAELQINISLTYHFPAPNGREFRGIKMFHNVLEWFIMLQGDLSIFQDVSGCFRVFMIFMVQGILPSFGTFLNISWCF